MTLTPASVDPDKTSSKTSANENGLPAKRHEEYQYLDLVREILETGEHRPDRYAS